MIKKTITAFSLSFLSFFLSAQTRPLPVIDMHLHAEHIKSGSGPLCIGAPFRDLGIHIGCGPPGAPYLNTPNYRARLHSPLLLEEALLRHPGLRVYAMHAGWPMLDDMIAMLYTHPQLYVDLAWRN